ncbi:MAG: SH3 domain-containing protein [Deltaproteobacteria bacterium]|nr:SH3 domain-containing protein [Myxococcales bacterium]MDP3213206.1 SH3 domain-containing protein [Deltaproteobacteria bacterium]
MRAARRLLGMVGVGFVAVAAVGCAADEGDSDDWDEANEVSEIAVAGRWIPSASAAAAGDRQWSRYDDGPSWSGGRNCGGSLLAGTRELGDYLRASFRGVRSYDGYACRANTANTSQTSLHGTGRALDVYIPLSGGQADNTVGDAVANWLVANAASLGVQLVIWDRSSWNASRGAGAKLRGYGGPHPHHDHLHIELNTDGAARRTAWFRNRSAASAPTSTPPAASTPTPTPTPTPTARPRMRVVTGGLNLRRGVGTSYGVIVAMPCGAAVTVVGGPVSGWYNVEYNGTRGWASGTYLTPEASYRASVCGG